jgi:hypothetical protein
MELSRGQVTNALNLEVATFTRGAIYATPKSDTIVCLDSLNIKYYIICRDVEIFTPKRKQKFTQMFFFVKKNIEFFEIFCKL